MSTPGAEWREKGEPDPHGDRYNCERHELPMGDLTDDEMANAVFMHGDKPFPSIDLLRSGQAKPASSYLTAAKERIRWLSRREAALLQTIEDLQKAVAPFAATGREFPECADQDDDHVLGVVHRAHFRQAAAAVEKARRA